MDCPSKINEINFESIIQAGFGFISETNSSFIDVVPNNNHTVLFNEGSGNENVMSYVELPWNSKEHWKNVTDNLKILKNRLQEQKDPYLIEIAITKYNRTKQNYKNIEILFKNVSEEKSNHWLESLIPKLANLVIESKTIIQREIPILNSNLSHSLSISKQQCACILANAFFCTFDNRSNNNRLKMPYFNFNGMFDSSDKYLNKKKIEKLKCIMTYFERVVGLEQTGTLTFSRFCLKSTNTSLIENSTKNIRKSICLSEGKIEDCTGAVQVDFANKYIGGGVLGSGCVQEEIRFVICPELLVSLLFMERMNDRECILIRGAERFSDYDGYAYSFKFKNQYWDSTKKDKYERILTDVLAIDAYYFPKPKEQYSEKYFWREVLKSYAGFSANWRSAEEPETTLPCIATGNWGCGVFNGDPHFKYLIQLISASFADRDLVYFTFGNEELSIQLSKINNLLLTKSVCVGGLVQLLLKFIKIKQQRDIKVFDFLEHEIEH